MEKELIAVIVSIVAIIAVLAKIIQELIKSKTSNGIKESIKEILEIVGWQKKLLEERDTNQIPLIYSPASRHEKVLERLDIIKKDIRDDMDFLKRAMTEGNIYQSKTIQQVDELVSFANRLKQDLDEINGLISRIKRSSK